MHQFSHSLEPRKVMAARPQDRRVVAEDLMSAAGGKPIGIHFRFGD